MSKSTICSREGCGKPVKCRALCASHYHSSWVNGKLGAVKAVKPKALCSVAGCKKDSFPGKRGLCNSHYLRWYRHGDVNAGGRALDVGTNCGKRTCPGAINLRNHMNWLNRTPEDVEKRKAWVDANRVMMKAYYKQRQIDNPELHREVNSRRRANLRNATPWWLTKDDLAELKKIFELAAKMERETGIKHDVDHIVPLNGKTVCGLHVPWNLRVITHEENNARPKVWHYSMTSTLPPLNTQRNT